MQNRPMAVFSFCTQKNSVLVHSVHQPVQDGGGRPYKRNWKMLTRIVNNPKGEKREHQTSQPAIAGRTLGPQ